MTVLVGMSGGVDSSVSAALLQRQGYRVVGGFIKNWSDSKDLWTGECAWRGERRDAMRVASRLGIPLVTFDFEKEYRARVVDELFRGYEAGETPNPDVLCNEFIKFGLFVEEANRLGIEHVATGHYAQIQHGDDGSAHLLRGVDPEKDQSYFLYRVNQQTLRRTLFPIGGMNKGDVRALAKELALPVAQKPDSQGICFIGKLDMPEFLRKKIAPKPGDIVDEHGQVMGTHSGLDAYTIGQRHRIFVSKGPEAWYVAGKDIAQNRLIVVQGDEHPFLFTSAAVVHDVHWTMGHPPALPLRTEVQVRYRQTPIPASLTELDGRVHIEFHQPTKAVAPGQSAVFYQGNECLGGGIILGTDPLHL